MSDDRKVKVYNRTKGTHYFVCSDTNRIIPITRDGYQPVPLNELYHVNATSKSFSKGLLEIDQSEKELLQELGYAVRSANTFSIAEFEKLITGSLSKAVKERLSEVTEHHSKEKLVEAARKYDLPRSKIDFIEKVTGMVVYDDELSELEKSGNEK
jgi:hypothetical protein